MNERFILEPTYLILIFYFKNFGGFFLSSCRLWRGDPTGEFGENC